MARTPLPAPRPEEATPPSTTAVRPRSRARRGVAALGLAVVLAAPLAACATTPGGDDVASLNVGEAAGGTSTTAPAPLSEEEIAEAQEAFQACMEEHGVDIQMATVADDGSGGGGMVTRTESAEPGDPQDMPSKEEMDAANEECQPLMEKVIQSAPKPDPEEMARMQEQALEFARCMRENGVDMPDPEFSDGGMTQSLGPATAEDPDMEAATEACRDLMKGPNGEAMPAPPAGGGPGIAVSPAAGGE